ncbi:hypothetical protein PoB_003376700 [Plakobranchus ocellatus]|uniref:Uncharacterized protein n=1 Tax=Plakobranchus ocellatus TaxID=259542 RepID=A0AAV4AJT0_9GAST|nr:hypothetical protein PoB_003376700 [Plakobranchus ocellatus]
MYRVSYILTRADQYSEEGQEDHSVKMTHTVSPVIILVALELGPTGEAEQRHAPGDGGRQEVGKKLWTGRRAIWDVFVHHNYLKDSAYHYGGGCGSEEEGGLGGGGRVKEGERGDTNRKEREQESRISRKMWRKGEGKKKNKKKEKEGHRRTSK